MIERSVKWHLLFWLILVVAGVASLSPYYQTLFKATMHRVVFLPVWWLVTYINLLVLMPRFWDSRKWVKYFISIALLIFMTTIIQRFLCIHYIYPKYFWNREPNADELNIFWTGPFIQFMSYIALPILLTMAIREGMKWYRESVQARQLVAEQQAAELSYLKAQINPHFLFNTLNNLYGLSLESSKKVPEMIIRLSDILSYSLYESGVNRIEIDKELKLIDDFIQLEQERYSDRIHVTVHVEKDLDRNKMIAPLLLMPLVENAFKHGVKESTDVVNIEIIMRKTAEKIQFEVINDVSVSELDPVRKSGIGLRNLKRRLELQYSNRYVLETGIKNDRFHALLKIEIDESV